MRRAALLLAAPLILAQAPAPAPAWTVDKAQSRLGFAATVNGESFAGRFARWDARIRFDPKNLPRSRVIAVVDMRSASTGDGSRDSALPEADWFATARFPTATYQATRFRDLGRGRYEAIGTLTIRGAARPATLPFTLAIAGRTATMRGTLTLDRRHFGVGQGEFANDATVGAQVRVTIAITATRAN